jgi:hypothetical protein
VRSRASICSKRSSSESLRLPMPCQSVDSSAEIRGERLRRGVRAQPLEPDSGAAFGRSATERQLRMCTVLTPISLPILVPWMNSWRESTGGIRSDSEPWSGATLLSSGSAKASATPGGTLHILVGTARTKGTFAAR